MRLVDYDLVEGLSEIYQDQQTLELAVGKVPYTSTVFFDPSGRSAALRQLAFEMNGIELTEGILIQQYRRELPAIRAAASRER